MKKDKRIEDFINTLDYHIELMKERHPVVTLGTEFELSDKEECLYVMKYLNEKYKLGIFDVYRGETSTFFVKIKVSNWDEKYVSKNPGMSYDEFKTKFEDLVK